MIACPQREKTIDKTRSRMSPSSEDVMDANNQTHSLARQVKKKAGNTRRSARLSCEICKVQQKEPPPGPALLAFLPLRREAAATLRERPVPLRLDGVALLALHLITQVSLPMDL